MKKLFFYLIFCHIAAFAAGQSLKLSGGYLITSSSNNNSIPHQKVSANASDNYAITLSLEGLKLRRINLMFTLGFCAADGRFSSSSSGLGGGNSTSASYNKSQLNIGFYPYCFKLLKKLQISFGAEYFIVIHSSYSGTDYNWIMSHPSITNSRDETVLKSQFFRAAVQLSSDFNLNEKWAITPLYKFSIGLGSEFTNIPVAPTSVFHNFELGLKRKL